jgi:PAS domain S-box-containing protein
MGAPEVRPRQSEEQSERFFRLLADAVPQLVWSMGPDGLDDYCNQRLCEYTGLSREELSGTGWHAILHPDDRERCKAVARESIANGTRFEIEYRLRRHDGAYLWHLGTAEPVRLDGRIVRWFGTCTEIEEQKRLAAHHHRALIDLSPDAVWQHCDWRIVEVNAAMVEMFRAGSAERLLGRPILDIIAPRSREAVRARIERLYSELAQIPPLEVEYVRDDGTHFIAEASATSFVRDGRAAAQVIARDVTERRRAEQAVADSEQRFRSLTNLSTDWYWEQDEQFRFTFFSDSREVKTVGTPQFGLRRWELGVEGVSAEQWAAHRAQLERHEPFLDFEYRRQLPDGSTVWRSVSGEPVFDADGRFRGYRGVGKDITQRKRMEIALRASESRLRAIIDNQPACVKLLDSGGRLLDMNPAGLRMIEVDGLEQVRGHCVYGIVAEEHREAFRALTERVCGGERAMLEFEIVGLKGTRRWLRTHAVPFREEARGDTLLLGITRDVTEEKRAERALAESEQRLRSLLDLSSDWYWEQDADFRFVTVAPRLEAVMGVSAKSDLGKTRWELPAVGVPPEEWAAHRRMLESHLPFRDFEYQRLNDRGETVWISVSGEPMFDERGGFRGYRGIGRNVTARKHAERALAESEQRFRSFMDNLPAVAWIKDSRFRYTWVSSHYERMHARAPAEVIGRDDFELWPVDLAGRFRGVDEQVLRENRPLQMTDEMPTDDGKTANWLVVKFPLPDAGGGMGVGGIRIDITERVELERALRENQQRVVEATETVRTLMNRLVHAQEAERRKLAADLHDLIGQKLTALGLDMDMVRRHIPQATALSVAPRLHQMSTLLEETIGTIRAVMSDLRPQALDEHGLSAALHQYAASFEARTGLHVKVKGAEPPRKLPHSVAIALFRIAQEALTNAAKHSGASRVVLHVRKDRGGVELAIEDDGRGFPKERGPRPRQGGGWGLPMMRERAEAVGGRLRVERAERRTRIIVEVPLEHAD